MLYNYPKNEISKFQKEIFESVDPGISNVSGASNVEIKVDDVSSSIANLKPFLFKTNTSNITEHHFKSLNKIIENQLTEETTKNNKNGSDNKQALSPNEFRRLRCNSEAVEGIITPVKEDNHKSLIENRRSSINTGGKRIGNLKVPPTNVTNKIILWTDNIYEKHGDGCKLTYLGFKSWVDKHPRFIKNFSKYFRPQLWLGYNHPVTNQLLLSYKRIKPALDTRVHANMQKSKSAVECRISLYGEFVMYHNMNSENMPARIIILKDLDFIFNEPSLEIKFKHCCKNYSEVTNKFQLLEEYSKWKKILENYSRLA